MAYIIVSEWTKDRTFNSKYQVPEYKTPLEALKDLHTELERRRATGETTGYTTHYVKEET